MRCILKTVNAPDARANRNWWSQVEAQACEAYIASTVGNSPFCFMSADFDLDFETHSYQIGYEVPSVLPIVAGDRKDREAARELLAQWRVEPWG